IGDVAEAAIEGDVENPILAILTGSEARSGFTQTHAANVLMRCQAGDGTEGTKEMVRAQTRFAGECVDAKRATGMLLDHSNRSGGAGQSAWWRRDRGRRDARHELNCARS